MTETSNFEITDEQRVELKALLDQGQEIEAVKLCRSYLDCDLVQAKVVVDSLTSIEEVGIAQNNEMGLMSPLGIVVLVLILGGYYFIR
jgi:ribosomal protein L7/L12